MVTLAGFMKEPCSRGQVGTGPFCLACRLWDWDLAESRTKGSLAVLTLPGFIEDSARKLPVGANFFWSACKVLVLVLS